MTVNDVYNKTWKFDRSKLIGLFYNCAKPTDWVILELKAAKIKVLKSELKQLIDGPIR